MGEFEIYLIALILAALPVIVPSARLFWLIVLPAFVVFLVIARFGEWSNDITKFAMWMTDDFSGYMVIREIVYFSISRAAYSLLGDERLAFLLMDAGWILLAIIALRARFGSSPLQYAALAMLLLSFPVLMGFQNFYRQHIATGFLILAYHSGAGRVFLPGFSFIAGIFSHNSIALTAPALLLRSNMIKNAPLAFLIFFGVTLCAVAGLGLMSAGALGGLTKSNNTTGLNMSLVYLALFIVFFLYFLYTERGNLIAAAAASPACFSSLFITPGMIIFFADAAVERTAMIFLILMIPDIVASSTRFGRWERLILLLGAFLLVTVPMAIFPNTRNFVT